MGLYHVGAREYDPRTARWLQRDPLDVAGGHPNVYVYSENEPVNLADPSGLGDSWWDTFKRWYMGGMGGLSEWVDQNLLFGLTARFGTTAGLYDCGQASGWEVARDASLWGGGLLLVGLSSLTPADEATGAAVGGIRGAHNIQRAKQLGQQGEQAVGISQKGKIAIVDKTTIRTNSGRRVPDKLDRPNQQLIEVKNVKHLELTKQLGDYLKWCEKNKFDMILYVRTNTTLGPRLQQLVRQGRIQLRRVRM
jgi:hypothetical protein